MTAQTIQGNVQMARRALQTDGLVCAASGVFFTLGASPLSPFTGVEPSGILLGFGLFLLVYGLTLFALASRPLIEPSLPVSIIVINIVTAAFCLFLLVADPLTFTDAGRWLTLALMDVVVLLAIWQFVGLRRMR